MCKEKTEEDLAKEFLKNNLLKNTDFFVDDSIELEDGRQYKKHITLAQILAEYKTKGYKAVSFRF